MKPIPSTHRTILVADQHVRQPPSRPHYIIEESSTTTTRRRPEEEEETVVIIEEFPSSQMRSRPEFVTKSQNQVVVVNGWPETETIVIEDEQNSSIYHF